MTRPPEDSKTAGQWCSLLRWGETSGTGGGDEVRKKWNQQKFRVQVNLWILLCVGLKSLTWKFSICTGKLAGVDLKSSVAGSGAFLAGKWDDSPLLARKLLLASSCPCNTAVAILAPLFLQALGSMGSGCLSSWSWSCGLWSWKDKFEHSSLSFHGWDLMRIQSEQGNEVITSSRKDVFFPQYPQGLKILKNGTLSKMKSNCDEQQTPNTLWDWGYNMKIWRCAFEKIYKWHICWYAYFACNITNHWKSIRKVVRQLKRNFWEKNGNGTLEQNSLCSVFSLPKDFSTSAPSESNSMTTYMWMESTYSVL